MTDNPESKDKDTTNQPVDLSALQGLSFNTAWDNQPVSAGQGKPEARKRPSNKKPRDRRFTKEGGGSKARDTRGGKFNRKSGNKRSEEFFKPTVKVYITPEELPFRKLIKVMRSSCRTYELFDIAKIILEKPERYILNIEPLDGKKEDPREPFYITQPSNVPFASEAEAISYVVKNNIEAFFDIQEIEKEAPSGSFSVVNRCGISGELLAPPNYHKYNEILTEHCSVSGLTIGRVEGKIESVSEPDLIQTWVEKMTKQKVYILKDRKADEPQNFSSLESAKNFLVKTRANKIFKRGSRAKISGVHYDKLPNNDLKKSIKVYLDSQARFPLDTATGLRVRLRKMNFSIFKKSAKNISFVCSVKRKQSHPESGFSPTIQALLDFILKNEEIKNSDISEKYLGIKLPKNIKPTQPSENSDATEASEEPILSVEDQGRLKQLKIDLYWLVSEGYVTEFANGELVAIKIQEPAKPKKSKETEKSHKPVEESTPEPSNQSLETTPTESDPSIESGLESKNLNPDLDETKSELPPVIDTEISDSVAESIEVPLDSEEKAELDSQRSLDQSSPIKDLESPESSPVENQNS